MLKNGYLTSLPTIPAHLTPLNWQHQLIVKANAPDIAHRSKKQKALKHQKNDININQIITYKIILYYCQLIQNLNLLIIMFLNVDLLFILLSYLT